MIIYKHAVFIKIIFEMNGGQPAQQELFQASFYLRFSVLNGPVKIRTTFSIIQTLL
jgi:hypothetical protein